MLFYLCLLQNYLLHHMIDYLTEKTTYYKILSLINNNYELFENLTDSLVFDVSSQSDEINVSVNSRLVNKFF